MARKRSALEGMLAAVEEVAIEPAEAGGTNAGYMRAVAIARMAMLYMVSLEGAKPDELAVRSFPV